MRVLGRTVEDRGNQKSGKASLLERVQEGCDIWGVRVVGPWCLLGIGHDSDAYEGRRIPTENRIKVERMGP